MDIKLIHEKDGPGAIKLRTTKDWVQVEGTFVDMVRPDMLDDKFEEKAKKALQEMGAIFTKFMEEYY